MAPSQSLSRTRTVERIQSQSQSRTMTHAICLTLLLSLSSILNVTAQKYSFAGQTPQPLLDQDPNYITTANADDWTLWDATLAFGYGSCSGAGGFTPCLALPINGAMPWSQPCSSILNADGVTYPPGVCPFQYVRSLDQPDTREKAYSEMAKQIPLTAYSAGTILNVVGAVSQFFEANSNETHYIYIDYYRGPYNRLNFNRGYFQPQATNNITTFLFRDVIMAEEASSYPVYTKINHNRPLPTNVTFAIFHIAVSSGPFQGNTRRPHPISIFDVQMFARPLETGPKVNVFYNGPTPARSTARVYISTSQCLRPGNFSDPLSQLSFSFSGGVSLVGTPQLSLVQSGANQLYVLELTFPQEVSGYVNISLPAGRVFNEFAGTANVISGNSASNILTLEVLTLVPSLIINSPNYQTFPAAQQSRNIQYNFNFSTDVYGFDITRVRLCRTNYQNDTCAEYKKVNTSTNFWDFPGFGIVTGTFLSDPAKVLKNYTLSLTNVPDGTYRVRVLSQDVLSGASENLRVDVDSQAPIRVDNVRPSVTITPTAANTSLDFGNTYVNQDNLIVFTLQFSELIASLNSSHLQVNGGGIVGKITPVTTAPNSKDPSGTWCNSITTASASTTCRSQYTVQVNHTGTDPNRTTITLSYYPSDTVSSQSIVDLAGNPLNSTGTSFPTDFRQGSIIFSNTPTSVVLNVWQQDLLTNEFQVSGMNKTHNTSVRYNISFDYPVLAFNFNAQATAGNLTVNATRGGAPVTLQTTWGATNKLDNYTFQSTLTYATNINTTLLTIQLKPLSVADVAGVFNLASNAHQLNIDTKPPVCNALAYAPGLDRFASYNTHSNFTKFRNLTYIFTFDEPVHPSYVSAFTTTFQNIYSRSAAGIFNFTTANNVITAFYTPAADLTDNGLNVAVRLFNVTDVYENTATVGSFSSASPCFPASFEFDFIAPNMTFVTDKTPFARNSTSNLIVSAPRYGAPLTNSSSIVVKIQFNEWVNLTQAALLYQLERPTTPPTLVMNNGNITAFEKSDCAPGVAPINTFCRNFSVTVVGEDTAYSILSIHPDWANFVTDLAGNPVSNAGPLNNETYLTDQTAPRVKLTTTYPFLDTSYRTNQKIVQIDITFSKHIDRVVGNMTGICRNGTHNHTLTSARIEYPVSGDPTSRTVFFATFNVSQYDMSICEFTIHPNDVYDLVGNTLQNTTSVFISTRFANIKAEISSPRGWLTNDLNPIPFCIYTDTEAVLYTPNFGGPTDSLNNLTTGVSHRLQNSTTVPLVYDAILNVNLPTQNRTYNSTTRMFCANIIPTSSAVTDIRILILENTLRDIYNNSNQQNITFQIRRFDLNPETYENLVKDGIIVNSKLANNSVAGRNIQDGTIQQHHMANNSIGTNQLIDGAVQRQDIAQGAVGANEIAAGVVNNTHLANGSVDAVKLADNAVTNTKLANNSITSEKIVDGSILTQDLANNSITFDKLVADAVRTINILNGTITTEKIAREAIVDYLFANNSVETRDIKERAITTTKIAVEAVTGTELANNSVVRRHLNNGSVDSTVILDGTITQLDLADNSVGQPQLQNGSVNTRHIVPSAVTSLEILDATIVQADLANDSVGRPQIQNDSVNEFKLASLSVETRHIKPGAVTFVELATDAVTSDEILNGSIHHVDMANSSVGTFTIIPNSVTFLNMANNSIDEFNLVDSSVTTRSIRDSAVTTPKIANESVTNPKVAPNTINTTQIQASAVNEINIANNSISNRVIQNAAISTNQIQQAAITNVLVAPSTINATQIQEAGVTESNVANNSISSRTIIPQAVGTREIAEVSVTAAKLANDSVTYRTIAPGSIDSSKIIPGSIVTSSLSPQVIATINFQNGTILNEFIAPNAINTSQIQPGAVDTINIAVEAVGTAQLGYRAITGEKIAFDQISLSHFTDDVNSYLSSIMAETSTSRPLDGFYIHNASLYGYKLANGTVGTQQIGDAAVTEVKIAENAVTWRQIAPKTINSDNLGDSSVLGIAIAHSQIQPHHLVPDFFTNSTLTSLATALTGEQKGLSTKNFASGSINAAQVITPGTVTNDLLGDKEVSLRKLSDSAFTMFTNMYNRLAQLEAQMTTLLNNIDSRCIFNTTFTVANVPPVAVNTTSIHTPMHTSSAIEHYMSVHPDLIAEAQRRATEANTPRAFHTEQVNTVQYPKTIVEGAKYCGDGAGVPANNGTATDKSSVLNSAANMNPSTLVMAILALLCAAVQL